MKPCCTDGPQMAENRNIGEVKVDDARDAVQVQARGQRGLYA